MATDLQAADSRTKFLKSGNDQIRTRELLGVEDFSSGRMSPQVCGGVVSDRITVSKVFVSDRTSQPPRTKGDNENVKFSSSAAISAHRHATTSIASFGQSEL